MITLVQIDEMMATGVQVHYYTVCKRKLWLFTHQISFEDESDYVLQGKILHETSYKRSKSREVIIDQLIKIDIIDDEYIGEIKSSSKMAEADRAQLLYYLYVLGQMGVYKKGKIHYPKEKRVEEIELSEKDSEKINYWLTNISEIVSSKTPPKKVRYPYCTKCAYYSFCWVGEED